MGLKSNQQWTGLIVCKDATGALSTPTVGPVGALYVNGVLNAAAVTVSGSGPYKWTVTLPALAAGDLVSMYITATIAGIATAEVVAEAVADTYRTSDIEELVDDIGVAGAGLTAIPTIANVATVDSTTTIGATGLTSIAAAVWDQLTSALTTVGSVGALVLAKLGLITSGTVSVSSPVASGKNVTTIQGDDYDAADGRAIEWTVASPATLTGGTVAVIIEGVDTYTGSVVDETTIRLELTAAQTAAIPVGPHRYQVIHTQTVALGEDVTTLVQGTWTSARRVSA